MKTVALLIAAQTIWPGAEWKRAEPEALGWTPPSWPGRATTR